RRAPRAGRQPVPLHGLRRDRGRGARSRARRVRVRRCAGRGREPRVKFVAARTLADALSAPAGATEATRPLAGGTDLVVEMESGRTRPDLVVGLRALRELRGITETDEGLVIGAGTTCADILRSAACLRHADLL